MLDGFAMDDLHTVVIRALRYPLAACVAPATEGKDGPEPKHWSVMVGPATSSTGILLHAGPGAWTGDVPLVPNGAVSDQLVAGIHISAGTLIPIVP